MLVREAELRRIARFLPREVYLVFEIARVDEVKIIRAERMFAG